MKIQVAGLFTDMPVQHKSRGWDDMESTNHAANFTKLFISLRWSSYKFAPDFVFVRSMRSAKLVDARIQYY